MFRAGLRIEPGLRQVEALPRQRAEWRLSPSVTENIDAVTAAAGFPTDLAVAIRVRLKVDRSTGEGIIVPDPALLDLFTEAERARWWFVLAGHTGNRSQRWPVAVRVEVLEALAGEARFAEAARRVRAWGVRSGGRMFFSELAALEDAFASRADRNAFLQRLLGAETEFVKLVKEPGAADADAAADYWQRSGSARALEPVLRAIQRIEGHDRVDIAHLLPRLARALLYTFPPDFTAAGDPAVENANFAARFFKPEAEREEALDAGFSDWLAVNCEPLGDRPREFGDVVLFEDPARTRWPFAMVYIADGIVFGRRPALLGPWELMEETEIARLNPRLRGGNPAVYRRKSDATDDAARVAPLARPWNAQTELKELPSGPWGRLKSYDVLLAPSTELLESIPAPDAQAKWSFFGVTAGEIDAAIEEVPMPHDTRAALERLFAGVEPDRRGLITVFPDSALVLATPAGFRERLFPRLVHGAHATDHAQDVLIPTRSGADAWFSPEMLSPKARETVLRLVYRRGPGLMLSDFGTLWHELRDPQDRLQALRVLFRTPALIVLMERPVHGEAATLADYWRLDQQKSVRRLLESFSGTSEMNYIDIVHLLPPMSREMMNVYFASRAGEPTPSCYWSALNFAAERPDSRLLITPAAASQEGRAAWRKLRQNYEPVPEPARLGDIVVYRRRKDGEVLHMCAFVAADVVYTKNGFGYSNPWCLMRLGDVDALYKSDDSVERLAFRKNAVAK